MYYHGGSKNRGCEAIVRSAVPLIKEKNPNAIINLASLDAESDRFIPGIDKIIDVSRLKIKKYSLDWFISIFNVKFLKNDDFVHIKQNQKLVDLIPNHDLFLSIGGDNYCYGEQPWLYVINKAIKKAGKKIILWGASIGEEDLSENKINDLKTFDLLLVRETLTQKILEDKNIPNVKLCADGAFTMDKELLPLPEGWQEGNMLGFNFSPLVWKKNPASFEAAKKLVKHILESTNLTIAFTPHVMISGNDDYECLEDFYKEFKTTGRVILLPNDLNAIQYKGYISRMRFFIGARTHATIAAYSTLVPTMVLGYSVKSKGIAKDIFGEERLVLSLQEISNSEALISGFESLKKDEVEIKSILEKRIPEIRKMSHLAAEYLLKLT
jgi:polysaccharide pyruvyl transferase WcaK-like protein